jgi:hypothetical protein
MLELHVIESASLSNLSSLINIADRQDSLWSFDKHRANEC